MLFLLRNLIVPLGTDESLIPALLAVRLGIPPAEILEWRLLRKGIDARRKGRISFVLTVSFRVADEEPLCRRHEADADFSVIPEEAPSSFPRISSGERIVIVGSGPAGLFAALRLADYGLSATILERGKPVADRLKDVQAFWGKGTLDPESNVQFGEGGAGTFSDGKLTTRVRDPQIGYVLQRMVEFGAPPEIRYLAKPHIGTDRLRTVVSNIRRFLEDSGCRVRFGTCMTDLMISAGGLRGVIANGSEEIPCDSVVLAPGNSARDTYRMLARQGVQLELKPFAVGVRVEHPQELINRIQYGLPSHPQLPPADYALAFNDPATGRSAYSFCMCPGGVVVAGASEAGGVVTNGMSNHLRNSPWANSALVVTVGRDDFPGGSSLSGVLFQRDLEMKAFAAGGGGFHAPAQNLMSFMGQVTQGCTRSSYRPGVVEADLSAILPGYVVTTLRNGIRSFERKMRGFMTSEATLVGVETRTSAPVRIVRGGDQQAAAVKGLYPAGEGAGYAGGIMSAALDGIRVADAIAARITS
ncbi:putative protein [Geobacter sp. OR-1]|uniref:NAD(P)/FAD-dependent oxidoreductase n=1 Tax=Geobacter sp. OR-1 TaxID=1266765 RepID=UPI0005426894|nr:FAD-binding protein [Geobacter sp. OR-1]GAM11692.1 putative protein [Geobacter sp. OR-1]